MRTYITLLFVVVSTCLGAQGLVINEFVASNDSTSMIADDFGEYDDWVELYNNSDQVLDLSGYYFSDDIADPLKWRFPNGINIQANGYLVVWTDSDDEQGDLHTKFKLSKGGEQLILMDSFQVILDSLTFGEQETNVSMARIPNGTGDFVPRAPTFNDNNESVATTDLAVRKDFEIYPNPATSTVQIDFTKTQADFNAGEGMLQLIDLAGKAVLNQKINVLSTNSVINLDINTYADGLYILKIQTDSEIFLKKIVVEKND